MDINRVPYPDKPDSFDETFRFPENVTVLSSDVIGALRSRIGAYRGYVLALWARLEYDRLILKRNYELKLAEETGRLQECHSTQKAAREAAMLVADAREMGDRLNKKEASATFYGMLDKTYEVYMDILSRELTRRQNLGGKE